MTCKSNYRPVVERFGTKLQHKQHWWNDLLIKVHTVVTMNARSRSSEVKNGVWYEMHTNNVCSVTFTKLRQLFGDRMDWACADTAGSVRSVKILLHIPILLVFCQNLKKKNIVQKCFWPCAEPSTPSSRNISIPPNTSTPFQFWIYTPNYQGSWLLKRVSQLSAFRNATSHLPGYANWKT